MTFKTGVEGSTVVTSGSEEANAVHPVEEDAEEFPAKTSVDFFSKGWCGLPLIHPFDRGILVWNLTLVIMIGCNMIFIPYELSFATQVSLPLTYLSDAVFLLDIFVSFQTMLVVEQPERDRTVLVDNKKEIAREYLRRQFILDVLSVGPPFGLFDSYTADADALVAVLGALKCLKMFRILKAFKIMSQLIVISPRIHQQFNVVKVLLLIIYSSHVLGCMYYGISTIYQEHNWTNNIDSINDPSLADYHRLPWRDEYTVGFYWAAMTLTTVGYGDVGAVNEYERWFSSFVMVLGAIFYAVMLGSVTSAIQELSVSNTGVLDKLKKMDRFVKRNNLSNDLADRLRETIKLQLQWDEDHEVVSQFKNLHPEFRAELLMAKHRSFWVKDRFFEGVDDAFLKLIVTDLKLHVCLAHDVIYSMGSDGDSMFTLNQGMVGIYSFDDVLNVTLEPGAVFGEGAVLDAKLSRRVDTAIAEMRSVVHSLRREQLQLAAKAFPEVETLLQGKVAEMWKLYARKQDERHAEEALQRIPLFGDLTSAKHLELSKVVQSCVFKEGDVLAKEGELAESFFILQEGQMQMSRGGELGSPSHVGMGTLTGMGDHFGEIETLRKCGFGSTARVGSKRAVLLRFDIGPFRKAMGPAVTREIEALVKNKNALRRIGTAAHLLGTGGKVELDEFWQFTIDVFEGRGIRDGNKPLHSSNTYCAVCFFVKEPIEPAEPEVLPSPKERFRRASANVMNTNRLKLAAEKTVSAAFNQKIAKVSDYTTQLNQAPRKPPVVGGIRASLSFKNKSHARKNSMIGQDAHAQNERLGVQIVHSCLGTERDPMACYKCLVQRQTRSQARTFDPVWNEGFEFEILAEHLTEGFLKVGIYSRTNMGKVSSGCFGVCDIDLTTLKQEPGMSKLDWWDLKHPGGKEASNGETGRIQLRVTLGMPQKQKTKKKLMSEKSATVKGNSKKEAHVWNADDKAIVIKFGSMHGQTVTIVEPSWHGRIKVRVDSTGATKSYSKLDISPLPKDGDGAPKSMEKGNLNPIKESARRASQEDTQRRRKSAQNANLLRRTTAAELDKRILAAADESVDEVTRVQPPSMAQQASLKVENAHRNQRLGALESEVKAMSTKIRSMDDKLDAVLQALGTLMGQQSS
jgi:CRP-like cAMP-binding protein